MTNQDRMNDYADIAEALIEWFKSQEISESKSAAVMTYLLGVMAAAGCEKDVAKAMSLLDSADRASRAICLSAILLKD